MEVKMYEYGVNKLRDITLKKKKKKVFLGFSTTQ